MQRDTFYCADSLTVPFHHARVYSKSLHHLGRAKASPFRKYSWVQKKKGDEMAVAKTSNQ